MQKNKAEKNNADKKTFYGLALTILIVLCCLIVFLFTDSAYGEKETFIETDRETAEDAQISQARFENSALGDLRYSTDADGAYILQREGLSDARLILSFRNGVVEAFLLCVEMPALPEDAEQSESSSILEDRLAQERRDYYDKSLKWLDERLPIFTRSLDSAGILTDADMDDILYYMHAAIETQKRQNVTINGIIVRAYANAADAERGLHISVQRKMAQETQGE